MLGGFILDEEEGRNIGAGRTNRSLAAGSDLPVVVGFDGVAGLKTSELHKVPSSSQDLCWISHPALVLAALSSHSRACKASRSWS